MTYSRSVRQGDECDLQTFRKNRRQFIEDISSQLGIEPRFNSRDPDCKASIDGPNYRVQVYTIQNVHDDSTHFGVAFRGVSNDLMDGTLARYFPNVIN